MRVTRLQEVSEGLQRRLRDMMLKSFGIGLSSLRRNTQCDQHLDDQPMAGPNAFGEGLSLFSQKHPAIGTGRRQCLSF